MGLPVVSEDVLKKICEEASCDYGKYIAKILRQIEVENWGLGTIIYTAVKKFGNKHLVAVCSLMVYRLLEAQFQIDENLSKCPAVSVDICENEVMRLRVCGIEEYPRMVFEQIREENPEIYYFVDELIKEGNKHSLLACDYVMICVALLYKSLESQWNVDELERMYNLS